MTAVPDLILALDNGTQSLRALLFDRAGQLQGKAAVALHYQHPQQDRCELDPDQFWQALTVACQRLWAQDPGWQARVAAVTLTTQRSTVIALDEHDQPVHPAIVWMDQRRLRPDQIPAIGGLWELAFKLAGVSATVASFQADCEAAWLRAEAPAAYKRIRRYGLLSGFLSYKLTGEWRDAVGGQVGYLPFDFERQRWAGPRDWKWRACPIAPEWLPELVPAGGELGRITAAAAAATGVAAGTPLIAAAADKACEVLGSGCLDPDIACLSYGTTATVNLSADRHIAPLPFLPAYPAAAPGYWNAEYQIYRGYWLVSWFKEQFGQPEQARAAEEGGVPEQFFDELVNAVPAGAEGLILQPYWSPGVREPGPEARGAVIGWADHHTRAHLYRAILEGIAYGLRQGLENLERRGGVKVSRLRVSGGGSQSDAAMQLTADIFQRPAERLALYETSGLGAAINAAVGLGWHRDHASAMAAMTRVGRVFEPGADRSARYEQLYQRVYKPLYRQLRPLYRELQALR
ncbi:carbohydrate kinase [Permianibacter sp. IMCC34836]|uniref:FGGY-family carbohydrate kinase n=1 Tax=Permianibacter fluminis TaxID=2738515 RepID=UPI00155802BC|nr:FGGY-family carbohydrate kinase [Permianibacter fluminis]NQD36104.1 carbohydrate kinase [Permianibacter fluminis]